VSAARRPLARRWWGGRARNGVGRPRRWVPRVPRPRGASGAAAGLGRVDHSAMRGRLLAVVVAVAVLFTALVGRLGQVQLGDHADYAAQAAAVNTRTIDVPAVRGRILDRHGIPLADNSSATTVTIERRVVADSADGARGLLTRVAALLGRPAGPLLDRTHLCGEPDAPTAPACWNGSPQVPIPVATDVDPAKALSLVERPDLYPGIGVEAVAVRTYPAPFGANAAHLLGYLGRVTEAEVANSKGALTADDLVGRAGLERQYDAVLRGTPGNTVVAIDPRGLVTGVVSRTDPVPGRDVVTALDAKVQAATEKALAAGMAAARKRGEKADSGAAVVLDPRNGQVVAAASAPTYDPNVWTGGISAADYARLTSAAAGTPLISRVTDGTLPPASTFKAFSLPAAVAAGNPLTGTYECGSSYQIGNRAFHNYESHAYGRISLHRAIEVSCDTVFYDFAYRSWLQQGGLSAKTDKGDPFVRTAQAFGLGRRTGIDLPTEATGHIPSRASKLARWNETKKDTCQRAKAGYPEVAKTDRARAAYLQQLAKENCADGYQFRAGDAANLSIGQGEVAVTPLQMAVAYAAVANGGTVFTPSLATAFVTADGSAREAVAPGPSRSSGLDPKVGAYLRDSLAAVTASGTGAGVFTGLPRTWPVAGKTGTAEVFGHGDASWFVSYAPAGAPRDVVAVAVSQGGTGASTAAPIAAEIHRTLATLRP
jgi:penicillin-binding protein 2